MQRCFRPKWTTSFGAQGLAGLVSLHPGRAPKVPIAKLEARVLNRTLKHLPRDGSTHWSSRKLANELGDVSFSAVQRIWRKHGVRPHRLDTHMVSNDPDFETKAADVIGLYLDPPAHAAVFCVDEKTAIQALDRKDRMLRAERDRGRVEGAGLGNGVRDGVEYALSVALQRVPRAELPRKLVGSLTRRCSTDTS